jgi:hypothetical protein
MCRQKPTHSEHGNPVNEHALKHRARTSFHFSPLAALLKPIVVSQNWSWPISLATLAPMRMLVSQPTVLRMDSEMSTMPLSSKSMPLMADRPITPFLAFLAMTGRILPRNWCGRQNASRSASFTTSTRSGTARTLGVNLAPGKYLPQRGRCQRHHNGHQSVCVTSSKAGSFGHLNRRRT